MDVIGRIGENPGPNTEWGTGLTSTADNTIRRKSALETGDTNPDDPFDPAVEWDGFANNTFDRLGAHSVGGDAAPTLTASSPANGASGVTVDANVDLTFSEAVNVTGDWFAISCTISGDHAAVVTGGPTTFTQNPATDFAQGEDVSR